MAKRKVFIKIGSSNMDGLNAHASQIALDEFQRWFGDSFVPGFPASHPFTAPAPGVKVWTPRLPYSNNVDRAIVAAAATTVDYTGTHVGLGADSWIFIKVNTTGQGQLKKVVSDVLNGGGAGIHRVTIDGASPFAPAVAADGTLTLLIDSHSISARTTTTVDRTATTETFDADYDNKFVQFFTPNGSENSRRRIAAHDADTLTFDDPVTALPAVGTGFVVLTGAGAAQSLSNVTFGTISQGAILQDLQIHLNNAPCLLTGYDYNNYDQNAPGAASPLTLYEVNCVPELSWQLRNVIGETIYVIEIGVSSATISPQYIGTVRRPLYNSWLHDVQGLDFNPGSPNNIYVAVESAITSVTTLLAAQGDTPDFDSTFIILSDNEGLDIDKVPQLANNMIALRSAIRTKTGNQQMLWIMAGTTADFYGGTAVRAQMEAQLDQVAQDDIYSIHSTSHDSLLTLAFDNSHLNGPGQVRRGKLFFDSWVEVRKRANAAAAQIAELPTLLSLRTRVKRRYERSAVGNDATPTQLNIFINDSLREFYTTIGDEKAWFLRVIERVEIAAGAYPATITLPRTSNRLMRIERQSSPGRPVAWKGLGYTDEGRLRITLHDYSGGPFDAHFIRVPKELVADTDVAIVPPDYTELIVMLACKRLTENAGNLAMVQYYIAEADRMWRVVKRNCQLYDRMRKEQLTVPFAYDSTTNAPWMAGDEWSL